jgi:hypothetical protein
MRYHGARIVVSFGDKGAVVPLRARQGHAVSKCADLFFKRAGAAEVLEGLSAPKRKLSPMS